MILGSAVIELVEIERAELGSVFRLRDPSDPGQEFSRRLHVFGVAEGLEGLAIATQAPSNCRCSFQSRPQGAQWIETSRPWSRKRWTAVTICCVVASASELLSPSR